MLQHHKYICQDTGVLLEGLVTTCHVGGGPDDSLT